MNIEKYKVGEAGYTGGRKRDMVAVWHDSQLWLYPQASYPCEGMLAFIRDAWAYRGSRVKITGKYPEYHVETEA